MINNIVLVGRTTKDIELRQNKKWNNVCSVYISSESNV